jgi:hypothetical protein
MTALTIKADKPIRRNGLPAAGEPLPVVHAGQRGPHRRWSFPKERRIPKRRAAL